MAVYSKYTLGVYWPHHTLGDLSKNSSRDCEKITQMHLVGKSSTFFHQLFWDIHLPFLCLCLCQHAQILDYVINKADESDHFFSCITVVQASDESWLHAVTSGSFCSSKRICYQEKVRRVNTKATTNSPLSLISRWVINHSQLCLNLPTQFQCDQLLYIDINSTPKYPKNAIQRDVLY